MDLLEKADLARENQQFDVAAELYTKAMQTEIHSLDDTENIRFVEVAILSLVTMYAEAKKVQEIQHILTGLTKFIVNLPKAKTAKLLRKLFELSQVAGMAQAQQQEICQQLIEWARAEKRTFLRHRLQFRLAVILFDLEKYVDVLHIVTNLLREVRRLDDKAMLVEIHLLESRVQHRLRCLTKARAAYVAAHTNANVIYCPPLLQSELDLQSGLLYLDEKDPKTAYSYFCEAFEGFNSVGGHSSEAVQALKYMLLCKVASGTAQEISAVISSRNVMKFHTPIIHAMRDLGNAYRKRDLQEFKRVTTQYESELQLDCIIKGFLDEMYDTLLEEHLQKITEPYEVVQISHIASLVGLDSHIVEAKLSQMILDKKLTAILDQKQDCLVLQNTSEDCSAVEDAFVTVESLSELVQVLYDKVNGKIIPTTEAHRKDKKASMET